MKELHETFHQNASLKPTQQDPTNHKNEGITRDIPSKCQPQANIIRFHKYRNKGIARDIPSKCQPQGNITRLPNTQKRRNCIRHSIKMPSSSHPSKTPQTQKWRNLHETFQQNASLKPSQQDRMHTKRRELHETFYQNEKLKANRSRPKHQWVEVPRLSTQDIKLSEMLLIPEKMLFFIGSPPVNARLRHLFIGKRWHMQVPVLPIRIRPRGAIARTSRNYNKTFQNAAAACILHDFYIMILT